MDRAVYAALFLVLQLGSLTGPACGYSGVHYTRRGDINLGGLVPLHNYDEEGQRCGTLRTLSALKRVEALVYAVDRINANESLLSGLRLGFEIYDTCSSNAVTLRDSLNFIPSQRWVGNCSSSSSFDRSGENCPSAWPPIVGVVGPQRSGSSVQAAILLGLYRIPQVSYLSTSDELSNTYRYPYFLRTVGPDSFQVAAIAELLAEYDWRYVSFVNSDDAYGKSAQQAFRRRAQEQDLCVAITRTISLYADDRAFDELVIELLALQQKSHAVVVVLFVQLEMAKDIFAAASRAQAWHRFVWIGSDGWGNYGNDAVKGSINATLGAFTLSPLSSRLEEFDEYFQSLNTTNSANPWLVEFLETYGGCLRNATEARAAGRPSCDEPGLVRRIDDGKVSHETLVMDSVYTFAHALESMRSDLCPGQAEGLCANMTEIHGDALLDYLMSTAFTSLANGWISFTKEGDMYGRYAINHLQWNETSQSAFFRRVGEWRQSLDDEPSLKIDSGLPWYLWDGASLEPDTGVPRSVCSDPCLPGEKTNRIPDNLCCWTCTVCEPSDIVAENGTECLSCIDVEAGRFAWPNADQSECVPIPSDFVLAEQGWAVAILTVGLACVCATLFTMAVYIYNREMPLIKASSRELSYIIFAGILLSYVTAIVFSVAPSPFVCVLRRLGPSIATSFIYASIATKTIRLYRIFSASRKSAKRPNYIGPVFQVVLSLSISSLAAAWTVAWLIVDRPEVMLKMPDEREKKLQVTCKLNNIETIGVMAWDVGLVLVCCLFAFMTRKLPENYNETRFINFCSFCTLIVFVTFSPIYFTSGEPYYQASYYSAGLLINATVTLTCLFVVKLYALYFVDEEEMNVFTQSRLRANTKTASTRSGRPAASSVSQSEVHQNPSYVSESVRRASDEPPSKVDGTAEAAGPPLRPNGAGSAGFVDRLRANNKVDPSRVQDADANAEAQNSTRYVRTKSDTSAGSLPESGPRSPQQGKEAKVFFSPDLVECNTHM